MERVGKSLRLLYGLPSFGFMMVMSMNLNYYAFFLTDVALVGPAVMATILMLGRIIDMALVPIVGVFLEKSNLPWGKYRSWLLVGAPLIGLFFTLMFINPNFPQTMKIVYLVTMYGLAHLAVNFTFASHYALLPVIAKHSDDRVTLSARRSQFSSIASIMFGLIAMPLMLLLTGSGAAIPSAKAMVLTTGIFSVIMVSTYWIIFAMTEKYDQPQKDLNKINVMPQQQLSTKAMVSQITKNPPFISLWAGEICRGIANFIVTGTAAYYFRYVVNDMAKITLFFTIIGLVQFGASIFVPAICKFIDKRTVYISGFLIVAICQVLAYLFAAESAMAYIFIVGASYIGAVFTTGTSGAMYSDATDYGEWKSGLSARGFLMSMANMPPKISLIITTGVLGFSLATLGFVAGVEQTPEFIAGLRVFVHIVPAAFSTLGFVIVMFINKLTIPKVQELQKAIQERKQAEV